MSNDLLKVLHIQQPHSGACLPTCAAMILNYLQRPVPIKQLSNLFGTRFYGTPSSRITRLQQSGFRVTYQELTTFDELQHWIKSGHPPIVSIMTGFLDYWIENTVHAVVVVGVDERYVYVNDPYFASAPQKTLIDGFLAAWIEMDEMAAIIER